MMTMRMIYCGGVEIGGAYMVVHNMVIGDIVGAE